MARKGVKFGIARVEAISGPLDGILISDTVVTTGVNQWLNLVPAARQIEGVTIKARAANTGTVYVTGTEGNQDGFALAKSETLSIATDDLFKVRLWVPTTGDGVSWLAIERVRD